MRVKVNKDGREENVALSKRRPYQNSWLSPLEGASEEAIEMHAPNDALWDYSQGPEHLSLLFSVFLVQRIYIHSRVDGQRLELAVCFAAWFRYTSIGDIASHVLWMLAISPTSPHLGVPPLQMLERQMEGRQVV